MCDGGVSTERRKDKEIQHGTREESQREANIKRTRMKGA